MIEIKLKVGLVGYGMAGEFFHAPLIHTSPGLLLHAVVERTKEKSREKYPNVTIVRSIEELLAMDEIDLVVIASPNNTHYEYALRALKANKHVVVDKPFTEKAGEALELINIAKEKGKILTVYQNRRLDSDFLTVKKLIEEGTIGNILEYKAHYDRFRPNININSWKEGAGVFYDLGPHLLDQAIVLFGKPLEVSYKIEKQREGALAEDYFEVSLSYSTTQAMVSASMLQEKPRPRFLIRGAKGTFTKYGLDPQENLLKAGKLPLGEYWGSEPEETYGVLEVDGVKTTLKSEKGNYPSYYENIFKAITKREKLLVDPEDAAFVIQLIENGRNKI